MRITTPRWTPGDGAMRAVALEVLIHGPLSRSEVARRLDLSPGSLTRLATPLLESGRVRKTSASVFSEHEIEALDDMSPQSQAELLLERSINHFRGANEAVHERSAACVGKISLTPRLNDLFTTAINSDDLDVRVAGIEVDIAARDRDITGQSLPPDAAAWRNWYRTTQH